MILTHPSEVRALLQRLGVRPNRTLGQNFLIDVNVLRIILDTARLHPDDTVLEVGAGCGVLTEWLARRARRVVAVEKDARLAAYLRKRFEDAPNIEIIEADVMDRSLDDLLAAPVNKMAANLPYSISSRLLYAVAASPRAPETVTVTVQKEVAERIAAQPGSRDYGLLSVAVQRRYEPTKTRDISRTCFLPPPEVSSSLIHLVRRAEPLTPKDPALYEKLVKSAFEQRRKQILGIIEKSLAIPRKTAGRILEIADIPAAWRPEMISVEQWVRLADSVATMLNSRAAPPVDRPDA